MLYALSKTSGVTRWQASLPGELSGRPAVADEAVLVRTDGELRCFDPSDGSRRWTRTAEDIGSGVALVDDLVYTTHDGTVRALRGRD
nr:PQQ-binding-like beta-propeller repeat protein [Salinigranum rubrum]